jgi:hypothetical protein
MKPTVIALLVTNLLALGLVSNLSCAGNGSKDAWLSYRTPEVIARDTWEELPPSRVHQVPESKSKETINLLTDVGVKKLTPSEVRDILGDLYSDEKHLGSYLVRAVYNARGRGRFEVLTNGRDIVVRHGSLGRSETFKRSALVVDLGTSPRNVYVEVSVAE